MHFDDLPSGWQNCSLGDLLTGIQTGKSVRCDERPPQLQEKGLVKISAVTWGEFNENESKTLLSTEHLQSSHKIEIGDLLISRANTLELVGACVLVKNLSKNLYLSDKVLRLELDKLLKPLVLRYLNSKDGRTQIESLATGNQLSMRNISQDAIRAIELPLSPLAEQKVIAEKLDSLLAQVDNTKARLERIPEILKRFRQSVLAAAVSGKLTEEWRGQNSAEILHTVKLGDVIDGISQGWSPQCLSENTDSSSWGVIKTSSVQEIVFLEHENKKLPAGLDARPELKVSEGDILTTRAGPRSRCGVTCYVENVALNLMLCDKVYRYRVRPQKGLSKFLALQLNEIAVLEQIELLKTGISESGMNLTQSKFKELSLTWPSLDEQTEIVRRVEELFAFADRIEQAAQAALSRVNNLTQSILAKAFRGELTADWRAANPELISGENSAEALMARINAERAKVKTRKKA